MVVLSKPSLLKTSIRLSSAALGLTVAGGGCYYAIADPKFINKTQILLNGFSRLGNLVTTVSLICFDYFKTMQDNKNLVRQSDPIREEIRLLRLEHERVGLLHFQAEDPMQKERLQSEIKSIVTQLKALSVREDLLT
jgi:hypothetical protein